MKLPSFAAFLALACATAESEARLIVEDIGKESGFRAAGLEVGDELLKADGKKLQTPFDLVFIEVERVPRAAVSLRVKRGKRRFALTPATGEWQVQARPMLPSKAAPSYQAGLDALGRGDREAASAAWLESVAALPRDEPLLAAWLQMRRGQILGDAGSWDPALTALADARTLAERAKSADALLAVLHEEGRQLVRANRLVEAEARYASAVAEAERRAPESLRLAAALHEQGGLACERGQLDASEALLDKARDLRVRLAPGSLAHARSLTARGLWLIRRGRHAQASEPLREALGIQEKLAPASLALADTLNHLGWISFVRGDLADAEARCRRGLAIAEAVEPDSLERVAHLDNLGAIAAARGRSAEAEGLHGRALDVLNRVAPGSLKQAGVLNNLGSIAWRQTDVDRAEDYYKRAVAIWQSLAPDSVHLAVGWANLGLVARSRDDFAAAEEWYRKALDVHMREAPDSRAVGTMLTNLATIARSRKDLATAAELHLRALALYERVAPDSLLVAGASSFLGEIALAKGENAEAADRLRRALALSEALAPETNATGVILERLATVYRREGRLPEALALLDRALEAIEAHAQRLSGGTERRSTFTAPHQLRYRAHMEVLVAMGELDRAFASLERFRARGLLEMLSQRELLRDADVPADLAEGRRTIAREYDQALKELAGLKVGKDAERIDALLASLRELRARDETLVRAEREASPRAAQWRYPRPVDGKTARDRLDRGTVMLSYSVGPTDTLLFVVPGPGVGGDLAVHKIDVPASDLREQVSAFRRLVARPSSTLSPEIVEQAQALFDRLVRPAQDVVERAERLIVCPDGPLQTLPWAALRDKGQHGAGRWLIEWKPVHVAVSATAYEMLRRARPAAGEERWTTSVVAFGDPVPNGDFESLPATRREVEGILRMFRVRPERVRGYFGAEATEDEVKRVGNGVRYLHLACHAFEDQRSALDSALVLSPLAADAGGSSGWLQAWEIMTQMRIDSDVVTLSGCDSALGAERRGEGIVGLVRAFLFAGARSVVASLWRINDESTAALMQSFYGHLRRGDDKDEALRRAQIEMLRGSKAWAAPYHWSAVQLTGDWK
jgi:CHAT domain-containing protein/Tfp pilus assembly protein PilF